MEELRILLVEDNEDDRFLAIRQLQKLPASVTVETARNGEEAFRRLTGNRTANLPDLVLLDLQLPMVDGITILKAVRDLFGKEELPVVVLSSSDNPYDLVACREFGVSGYLAKPLNLSDLQEILPAISWLKCGCSDTRVI